MTTHRLKGPSGNLTTTDCTNLSFKMAIYPCTWFIPAMLAMQRSNRMLKQEGSDLAACEGGQIKNFFEQVGSKRSFDFHNMIVE